MARRNWHGQSKMISPLNYAKGPRHSRRPGVPPWEIEYVFIGDIREMFTLCCTPSNLRESISRALPQLATCTSVCSAFSSLRVPIGRARGRARRRYAIRFGLLDLINSHTRCAFDVRTYTREFTENPQVAF